VRNPVTDGEYLPAGDGVFEPAPDLLEGPGMAPTVGSSLPIALTENYARTRFGDEVRGRIDTFDQALGPAAPVPLPAPRRGRT